MRKAAVMLIAVICIVRPAILAGAEEPLPRAARSVHLWHAAPEGMAFYNEVTVEKSVPGSYFCVCGFRHGYFGIQELWDGKKLVLFSVWDPGSQNDPDSVPEDRRVKVLHAGEDVQIGRFGNEGTGGQSKFFADWEIGETVRCMVKATADEKTTTYAAFFYLNEQKRWKHLATFQTRTGGEPLRGYYSFVEDFRRNGRSARQIRRAKFGNGWVRSTDGIWHPITEVTFTADNTPVMNIDAGVEDNRFYLQNGGDTVNTTPLRTKIQCRADDFTQPEDPEWSLTWAEEFDYAGAVDPEKWTQEVGFIRNNEKQYYTQDRLKNARVEEGSLLIEAHKEPYKDEAEYTSASIHTRGKAEWTYGRFEVRAKLPTGRGTWPAIWMLGSNIRQVGWPKCGEIDIMENVGFKPETIHGTIHCQAYNHIKGTSKGGTIKVPDCWEKYHLYAVEWSADRIKFFLDNRHYYTFENEGGGDDVWPFDQPYYLILNLAIGGGWGGMKGIDDSLFPHQYYIDFVRVYGPAN